MDVSTRSTRWLGILLFSMGAVGCAQPGVSDIGLPTSPTSLSAGPSASPSSLSAGPSTSPSGTATLGPGASYDASGMWRFVTTFPDGNEDAFVTDVSQDANGNLSFLDEDDVLITLERRGTGVIITYRLSTIFNEGGECDVRGQGTVRLDTRTNTLTAPIRLKELGCSNERLGIVVTATKLS